MARTTYVKHAQVRKDKDGNVKPNRKCEVCQTEIKPGDPYKWVAPKLSPRYSIKRFRCGTCPGWQPWDLSSALWARIAQIQHSYSSTELTPDDVRDALESAASEIEELAQEKRDGAENIRDGFGHDTVQSEELDETAESLETWASEIRDKAGEIEDFDDEVDCETCDGDGEVEGDDEEGDVTHTCEDCNGTGKVENPEFADKTAELEEALQILDESPV